jgi:branched-chain amino acid transport system ATP-binding protein
LAITLAAVFLVGAACGNDNKKTLVTQILSIVTEINRVGTSVLLVEQNARAALRRAQRAYVLESGRVVLAAVAGDLLANPSVRRAYLGGDVAVPIR